MVKELTSKQRENRIAQLGIINIAEWDKVHEIAKQIKNGKRKIVTRNNKKYAKKVQRV